MQDSAYDISLQEKSLLEKLRAKQLQCIHSDRDIDDITSDLKTLYAQLNRDAQKQDLQKVTNTKWPTKKGMF